MTRLCALLHRSGPAVAALVLTLLFAALPAAHGQASPTGPLDSQGLSKLIDQARGRVVLVNFWATWCGPCRKEFPDLERLRKQTSRSELEMISVSLDFDGDMLRDYLRDNPLPYPTYLADQRLMSDLKLDAIPKTWIFAPDGTMIQNHDGPLTYEALRAVVQLALTGAKGEE